MPGSDVEARKVLILDHNLLDVINVTEHLKRAGFEAVSLTSPNGALAKLEYERPDILLLDITMPRLNVSELLQGVRQDGNLEDTIIVLFSDLDAPTLQSMCMDNDIHGYFSKSMDVTRIGEFLDQFYEE
jgi:twitching motility two-component system response regulator PilH